MQNLFTQHSSPLQFFLEQLVLCHQHLRFPLRIELWHGIPSCIHVLFAFSREDQNGCHSQLPIDLSQTAKPAAETVAAWPVPA